ncbi:hypothetical protein PTKIN_Ptkin17bG0095900 [Pterospermum kingtungense]
MATEFIVETIHEETIKPASPTPSSLNTFKLSVMDQLAPLVHVPLIFWYPNDTDACGVDDFAKAKERTQRLKKSLSQTLARFYPFAGRMKMSSNFIECNDEGVDYIEARVNCLLQDILKQPNGKLLRKLIPVPFKSGEAATGRVLLVKVNFFECGGMAIVVCISHKIADMSTMSTFIKSWAAMARSSSQVVLPELKSPSSLFPPMDLPTAAFKMELNKGGNFRTRRFVFNASKILMLKAKAASTDVTQPTRVEAVIALLWKCAMAAATSNRGGLTQPSALAQVASLRKRMNPPVPDNCIGNLLGMFAAQTPDSETELQGLVHQLRKGIRELNENYVSKLQGGDAVSAILETLQAYADLASERDEVDFYSCSSWCRFGLYEVDFGWGKPRWVSHSGVTPPQLLTLMDSSDGEGIEAWMSLSEAEMGFFERNEELLQFASVNPSVIA